jgi:hypothetical protein
MHDIIALLGIVDACYHSFIGKRRCMILYLSWERSMHDIISLMGTIDA